MAIHESDAPAIQKAKAILNRLQHYFILDDECFSRPESDYYASIGYVQNDAGKWYLANTI